MMEKNMISNEQFITHFRWLTIIGSPILLSFNQSQYIQQLVVITIVLVIYNSLLHFVLQKGYLSIRYSHPLTAVDIIYLTYIYVLTLSAGKGLPELYFFLIIILGIRYGIQNYYWAVLSSSILYLGTTVIFGRVQGLHPEVFIILTQLLFLIAFGIMSSYIFNKTYLQQIDNEKLISELKDAYEKLYTYNVQVQELANRDPLTGLFNYRYFTDRLAYEIELAKTLKRTLSLIILDIDFFKEFNDKYGHPEGDRILREVSLLFGSKIRDQDILCRYGGEEFLVILPAAGEDEAYRCAERIRESIASHVINLDDGQIGVNITISGGVASYPTNANNGEQLLKIADGLLYSAKQKGRNTIHRAEKE